MACVLIILLVFAVSHIFVGGFKPLAWSVATRSASSPLFVCGLYLQSGFESTRINRLVGFAVSSHRLDHMGVYSQRAFHIIHHPLFLRGVNLYPHLRLQTAISGFTSDTIAMWKCVGLRIRRLVSRDRARTDDDFRSLELRSAV